MKKAINFLRKHSPFYSIDRLFGWGLVCLVRLYQKSLSPFLGQVCRFAPSCSHYAIEALERFGALKGSYLTVRRLLKCHPWHEGGIDPVPKAAPAFDDEGEKGSSTEV